MASQKTEEIIEIIEMMVDESAQSVAIAESIIDLKDRELRRKDAYIKRQEYITIFSGIFGLVCLGYAAWIC